MADELRPTVEASSLNNAHLSQPNYGEHVWALTHGGKLVEAVWGKHSLLYYDAWCYYPKIPQDVKALQFERFCKQPVLAIKFCDGCGQATEIRDCCSSGVSAFEKDIVS